MMRRQERSFVNDYYQALSKACWLDDEVQFTIAVLSEIRCYVRSTAVIPQSPLPLYTTLVASAPTVEINEVAVFLAVTQVLKLLARWQQIIAACRKIFGFLLSNVLDSSKFCNLKQCKDTWSKRRRRYFIHKWERFYTRVSNTRSAGHTWPAKAFYAARDALWKFEIFNI